MDLFAQGSKLIRAAQAQADQEIDEVDGAAGDAAPVAAKGSAAAVPRVLPLLPVRNLVVFPGTVVPLTVGREKSKRLLDAVFAGDKLLGIFAQRREDVEDPTLDDIYRVGTAAQVLKLLRMPDGTHTLMIHGLVRIGLVAISGTEPYWTGEVETHEDQVAASLELEALVFNARRTADQVIELTRNVPEEVTQILHSIDKPGALADFLSANLSLGLPQKQELLETFDVADRLRKVTATLQNQLEVLQLAQKLQGDVRTQIDKQQREYYLQEQLRAIQKELGQGDPRQGELADLRKRIENAGMPPSVQKEADRELARLERIPPVSPEAGVIRDYLEWLADMPWNRRTEDNLDLLQAERILDEDHYGLEKVKRRILEYLAVRKLNPAGRGAILCFAGPPGVGKTSLGQSIARALGRKFIRIALGGVRDEADIRGHRRTYIGAIPGRLVQEIRKAGVMNPVIMLDELDKLSSDFRGDPSSALLEVLDPNQNHNFVDHYLGVPIDLSGIMFIGTVNYVEPMPPPLRDRMEFIELAGYTTAEKLEIARRYLVPRQLADCGLTDRKITCSEAALRRMVEGYTREAGVRNLERVVGSVCRALAAKVARGESMDPTVDEEDLKAYLGPPRFERETALRAGLPGVVTGLAYTPVGGEIIFVEATIMEGRGSLQLTGQIGEVMRESTHAALSLIRSRASQWGIDASALSSKDIHIHVPAGATPKDGPSAGVAMFAALYSLLTNQVASPDVGMTGEITLRGLVLPIGGVKEKVLGAHRAGLTTVILPKRNEPDLEDVPPDVRREIRIVFAETVEDVLRAAIPDSRKVLDQVRTATKQKANTAARKRKRSPRKARGERPAPASRGVGAPSVHRAVEHRPAAKRA